MYVNTISNSSISNHTINYALQLCHCTFASLWCHAQAVSIQRIEKVVLELAVVPNLKVNIQCFVVISILRVR